jgi:hypothetical protein
MASELSTAPGVMRRKDRKDDDEKKGLSTLQDLSTCQNCNSIDDIHLN